MIAALLTTVVTGPSFKRRLLSASATCAIGDVRSNRDAFTSGGDDPGGGSSATFRIEIENPKCETVPRQASRARSADTCRRTGDQCNLLPLFNLNGRDCNT